MPDGRATPDRVYVTMQWTTPGSEPVEVLVRLVTAETRPAQIIPFKRRTRS